jgi:hypothetical protein
MKGRDSEETEKQSRKKVEIDDSEQLNPKQLFKCCSVFSPGGF